MLEFKEKKKANRKNWLGILVIVLVFGMTVVGCGAGSSGTDPALNGTWFYINQIDGKYYGNEYNFINGKFILYGLNGSGMDDFSPSYAI